MKQIWSVDLSDGTEASARSAVELLRHHGLDARVVDPRRWLTWHLDRPSVEGLAIALQTALDSERAIDEVSSGVESLLDDCLRWLA